VLDLGCGFGHHYRWMREKGAASVVGVDLSERMLERARAMTSDSAIEYRCAIEDLNLPPAGFDLVTRASMLLPAEIRSGGRI
jgi:2-polyprenyl-3-methyl-5-hydroxy-6-metoxy-1,4-benzoquinol methylase